MLVDALVLAGGRSSRLGGVPKTGLRYRETTLLERVLSAVSAARRVAVVGVADPATLPDGVVLTREEPAFGGPAAAIAAGLSKLAEGETRSDFTIVVACDMPAVGEAVGPLLQRLATDGDGVIAVDPAGRLQPLAAVYRTAKLAAAAAAARAAGQLDGLSTFQLIAGLHLTRVPVPSGATDDVDTWADAERLGVARPGGDTDPRSIQARRSTS